VKRESGSRPTHGRIRVVRLPSGAGLLLAIPLFLAVGVVSVAALLVAVSAVVVAPWFRGRGRATPRGDRDTIVLDRDAYRHVDTAPDLLESDRR
jgi:hypothetical protein